MSHDKRRADDAFNPFAGFDDAVLKRLDLLYMHSGITFDDIEAYLVDELKALKPASAIRIIDRCMAPRHAMASSILAAFVLQEKVETADRQRLTHLVDYCKKADAEVDMLRARLHKEEGHRATLEAERDGLQYMCTSAEAMRKRMQADIDRLRGERNRLAEAAAAAATTTGFDALPGAVRRRILHVISRRGQHRLTELAFDKRVVDGILMMTEPQVDKFVEFLDGESFATIVNPSAYMTSRIHALLKD